MVLGLAVPMVLALRVLFGSPDLASYEANREMFYDVTIWSTIIYFMFLRVRRFWSIPVDRVYESATQIVLKDRRVTDVLGHCHNAGEWRAQQLSGGVMHTHTFRTLCSGEYSVLRDFCGVKLVSRGEGWLQFQYRRHQSFVMSHPRHRQ